MFNTQTPTHTISVLGFEPSSRKPTIGEEIQSKLLEVCYSLCRSSYLGSRILFLFLWLSSDDVIKTLDICYQHPFRGGRSVLQSAMSNDTQNLARLDVVVVIDAINSLKKQMTEMNRRMVNMFQTLEIKLNSISAGVDSLRADVAGLQAFAIDIAGPAFADQKRGFAE